MTTAIIPRDDGVQGLFDRVNLACDASVNLLGPAHPGVVPAGYCTDPHGERRFRRAYRSWLPLNPTAILSPLPAERQRRHIERFLQRTGRQGGWILRHKQDPGDAYGLVMPFLERDYTPLKTVENSAYALTYYVPRSQGAL